MILLLSCETKLKCMLNMYFANAIIYIYIYWRSSNKEILLVWIERHICSHNNSTFWLIYHEKLILYQSEKLTKVLDNLSGENRALYNKELPIDSKISLMINNLKFVNNLLTIKYWFCSDTPGVHLQWRNRCSIDFCSSSHK